MKRWAAVAGLAVLAGCAHGIKGTEIKSTSPNSTASAKSVDNVYACLRGKFSSLSNVIETTTFPTSGAAEIDFYLGGHGTEKYSYHLIRISPAVSGSLIQRYTAGVSFPRMPLDRLDATISNCI